MSNIATMSQTEELTMSSREIAEVVESRHDNVKITIERLIAKGVIAQPAMQDVHQVGRNSRLYTTQEYLVGKRDSYVVVAQLSPEFTARLVDRWQELERQVAQPQVPQSFAEALRLAADTQEQLEEEHEQRKLADARRDSLQRTVGQHYHSLSRFARTFKDLNSNRIKADLFDLGYLYRKAGTYRVYRRYHEYFLEKVDETYGKIEVFPTAAGKALISDLRLEGLLTKLKRYQG